MTYKERKEILERMKRHLETHTTDCAREWSTRLGVSRRTFFILLDELRDDFSRDGMNIRYCKIRKGYFPEKNY